MNKYRKAESRWIKRMLYLYRTAGSDVNYCQVRRQLRSLNRAFAKIHEAPKIIRKGFKRLDYMAREFHYGILPHVYTIDENPIETEPSQWTKENPFVTRYLGKWHYKKETDMDVEQS